MTSISADDVERNWLWLGVDDDWRLAVFQTFGFAPLPQTVTQSLEEAETIDEFVADELLKRTGFCEGEFCYEYMPYSWRSSFESNEDEHRKSYIAGTIRTASTGCYVFQASGSSYFPIGIPSRPLTVFELPEPIRIIVSRTRFRNCRFKDLKTIGAEQIGKIR